MRTLRQTHGTVLTNYMRCVLLAQFINFQLPNICEREREYELKILHPFLHMNKNRKQTFSLPQVRRGGFHCFNQAEKHFCFYWTVSGEVADRNMRGVKRFPDTDVG